MHLGPLRVEVQCEVPTPAAQVTGGGSVRLGPLVVDVAEGDGWPALTWALSNRSDVAVAVRSLSIVFGVDDVAPPLRMFRHGYQSWSPSGVATLGVDRDPSSIAHFEFLQALHNADQRDVTTPGELRSEWVTVLADAAGALLLVGFTAGTQHDGTLRLRPTGDGRVELWAEAFLGDSVLDPGERRVLHGIAVREGDGRHPTELLGEWAASAGRSGGARTGAPYQVGWCSWYHYFDAVTEAAFRENLARADDWPFDVFQLDDGFQSAVGDWLDTNDSFPSGLGALADAVRAAGRRPGLWLAPFLAAPDSRVAIEHPEWLARRRQPDGTSAPLYVWWNPAWRGGHDGFVYGLDTTRPEVLAHLEETARRVAELGFEYLKLDFTFAPSVDGVWGDASCTPAQRVRAGFEALRRGAGDGTFILACGAPLSHVVGVVDAMRIGPDVAPLWALERSAEVVPGYLDVQPATRGAYAATLARSFMHRRLWLNDPDCVMLRTTSTDLRPAAARTWARAVGLSGGSALVSDNLALLDREARAVLDETLTFGHAADAAARAGAAPAAPDLMDHPAATTFTAAGYTLITEPATGSSTLLTPDRQHR
ncbi:MAG TPA: alpha-galactosidase [Acidimicrobiales bacterium]|nr:alpha-galactosidase [Acidimicrobiales bacterium]